ncbi:hypothetical protein NECAME_10327 [Necator americanus]|uniref:Uncharacterized protein n=1 Tax=Necator americanus TaxID=51031 RepID=W2T9G4_NECAM|nr:hypothetical protein NECAME_10327 [Necator americanus]ETN78508.1 hypothetical protein NECAME_10327 [Necator americanus]
MLKIFVNLYLLSNVGVLDNLTRSDILTYVVAGSGFDNFDVSTWDARYRCFRLMDNYNQTDVDETDKLSIRFNNVQGTLSKKKACLPACERIENQMQMNTSPDYSRHINYSFRVETSFTDLEV